MANLHEKALIFEISKPGRVAYDLPALDLPDVEMESILPEGFLRETPAQLPEVSELELMRHYTQLSRRTMGWILVFTLWVLVPQNRPQSQ